jgi:hypothetical protein
MFNWSSNSKSTKTNFSRSLRLEHLEDRVVLSTTSAGMPEPIVFAAVDPQIAVVEGFNN